MSGGYLSERSRSSKSQKGRQTGEKNKESNEFPGYMMGTFAKTSAQPFFPQHKRKIEPGFKMGMSSEVPTYFVTNYSQFYQNSYRNPYIPKLQDLGTLIQKQQEKEKINHQQHNDLNSKIISEQAQQSIKEQQNPPSPGHNFKSQQTYDIFTPSNSEDKCFFKKTVSASSVYDIVTHTQKNHKDFVLQIIEKPLFSEIYDKAREQTPQNKGFNIKREMFSEFVEKNDNQQVYAPISQRDRPQGKFLETKNFSIDESEIRKRKICRLLTKSSFNTPSERSLSPRDKRSFLRTQTSQWKTLSPMNSSRKLLTNPSEMLPLTPINSQLFKQNSKQEEEALDDSEYQELLKKRQTEIEFQATKQKQRPILKKDQNYRFNHISLAIPKPKVISNPDRFLKKDIKYINSLNEQISRDQINQQLSERFYGRRERYLSQQPKSISIPDTERQRNRELFLDLQRVKPKQQKDSQGNIFYRGASYSPSHK